EELCCFLGTRRYRPGDSSPSHSAARCSAALSPLGSSTAIRPVVLRRDRLSVDVAIILRSALFEGPIAGLGCRVKHRLVLRSEPADVVMIRGPCHFFPPASPRSARPGTP